MVEGGEVTEYRYGIHPLENIKDAYTWRYDSLDKAKETACELSYKHNVGVIVFKVVGSYRPEVIWHEE